MLLIDCPFCGPRSEHEFMHGGTDKAKRIASSDPTDDEQWIEQLIVPDNTMGFVKERWWHVRGCGKWMTLERNTLTHEIRAQASSGESD